jgi:tRNA modification GTPase
MLSTSDLIVAAATPPGPGARGIVRLAGDGLDAALAALVAAEPPGFAKPGEPGRLVTARLAGGLARDWGPIPVEILHWPGPAGPVGGPLAEVQLPASAVLVADFVAAACRHGGRLARGGEFTLRAFLAGRLDLVQAETVLAVVDASSPAELSAALDRMAAGSGGGLAVARDQLLDLVADIEAGIDFADETTPDGVPAGPDWHDVAARIAACDAAIAAVAERLAGRDVAAAALPRVVLVGPPNIGKSSLFNAVVGRDAALVADERGTTRDWLEAPLGDAAGPRCVLVDLPGLDGGSGAGAGEAGTFDSVAAEAQARGWSETARADLVVVCRDVGCVGDAAGPASGAAETGDTTRLHVTTRCDLAPDSSGLATSSLTGRGIAELRAAILAAVATLPPRQSPATTRLAVACGSARQSLAEAAAAVAGHATGGFGDESLVAADLRRAAAALADVTGAAIDVDLLDRIFARHCIGK